MKFTILTPENFKTTNWSGGTTTQLFIYPPTADYTKRDFNFRLSTAKVEVEKSNFTSLPGFSRKIMILDGKLTINHENHYTKTLNKFDTDTFEGDWKTTAVGICTDFNLMTAGKTHGELSALVFKESEVKELLIEDRWRWLFIYVFSGKVYLDLDKENHVLIKGNLLVINRLQLSKLIFKGVEKCELIISKIEVI